MKTQHLIIKYYFLKNIFKTQKQINSNSACLILVKGHAMLRNLILSSFFVFFSEMIGVKYKHVHALAQ